MEFKRYLEKTALELDREVGKILGEELKEVKETDRKLVPLLAAFAKSCQGGKRIRGVLIKLGYEIAIHLPGVKAHLGGEKEMLKVAAAYEIVHTAVLAHDDIIDQSPTRRDKPSLYQALGGDHYGISQAISLADYGFFLAFKIISEANFPQKSKISALELLSKVMLDTALGEILDLEKADPLVVMKLKTAYYTISGPLQMGAILGETELHLGGVKAHLRGEKLIRNLGKLGENLGIAFQIKDDILDSEVDFWGGIDNAKNEAEKFKNKALQILPKITEDPKISKILEQMAEYLVDRTK